MQSPALPPATSTAAAPSQTHYENFPVASWLCPAHLRPPIAAIYWFARTADDIADEGDADAPARLQQLAAYRAELARSALPATRTDTAPLAWPEVFVPLRTAIHRFHLPVPLLEDLLSAFEQDIHRTASGTLYTDRAELLDYCRRSANPVGRLLLHLYGVVDAASLAQSDAICTALQLINFWQDPSRDLPRGRNYFTQKDCACHGVPLADLQALRQTPETTKLIAECTEWSWATMQKGLQLVHTVPGRAGWELRLVVQGGLRIVDKIRATGYRTLVTRPHVGTLDVPVMLWRSLCMRSQRTPANRDNPTP